MKGWTKKQELTFRSGDPACRTTGESSVPPHLNGQAMDMETRPEIPVLWRSSIATSLPELP